MLEINPLIVRQIITRAKQFHAKELEVIPDDASNASDDRAFNVLSDTDDDPVLTQLKTEIDDLEPGQQAELVALMWLGRGDYDSQEWNKIVDDAVCNAKNNTANYLLGTPLLANYLEDGLEQLGYDVSENDS